jgi:hypothetical protein
MDNSHFKLAFDIITIILDEMSILTVVDSCNYYDVYSTI